MFVGYNLFLSNFDGTAQYFAVSNVRFDCFAAFYNFSRVQE
jgi:hypothetical protein